MYMKGVSASADSSIIGGHLSQVFHGGKDTPIRRVSVEPRRITHPIMTYEGGVFFDLS